MLQDGQPLFEAAEAYAVAHADEMTPQAIGMLCWGLASLHHHPNYVFLDSMASCLVQRAQHEGSALPQGAGRAGDEAGGDAPQLDIPILHTLSVVAWAFARWGHNDPRLFDAIRSCLPALPWQQEAAQAGGSEPAPAAAGAPSGPGSEGKDLEGLAPATVSNLAFAVAKQGLQDPALVCSLRQAAELSLPR
jgi:hypothetical protein